MGRPKKVGAQAFTVTTGSPENENGDAPDAQTSDALGASAGEGQKAPRARIMRWNENMRAYATLDHVSAEAVDEQWIQQEYGGGKYRVYYWGTMKNGEYGYLEKQGKEFIIDDSVPFRGALKHRAAAAPVQNPDGTVANGDGRASLMDMGMLQIFKTMQDNSALMMSQSRDNSAALAAMLERIASPRDNGMVAMLTVLTPLLTPLLTGLIGRKDPVELATQIAALSRNEKSGLGSLHDLIELKDTLALLGGGNDDNGDGAWMRIAEKTFPGVIEILKQESAKTGKPLIQLATQPAPARIAAPPTAPSPGSTSPPAGSASSAGTPSPSAETPVQDEWTGLEPHMQTLANFAQQNRDPYGVMQTIRTLAPPQMLAAVRELVARDDGLDVLLARFPILQPYRAWTSQLLDEFYTEFFGEDEGPDGGAGEGEPSDGVSA